MKKTTKNKCWKASINLAWFLLGAICAAIVVRDHYEAIVWDLQTKMATGVTGAFYPNLETKEVEFRLNETR